MGLVCTSGKAKKKNSVQYQSFGLNIYSLNVYALKVYALVI